MAFKQEVNVPLILTIGIVSGIMLLVIVIGTQAWFQNEEQSEIAAKAMEFPHQGLIDLQNGQRANINSYRWVDQKNGVVAIPIGRAMEVMVQTQGNLPTTAPSRGTAAAR
jgi:hypothetical protein